MPVGWHDAMRKRVETGSNWTDQDLQWMSVARIRIGFTELQVGFSWGLNYSTNTTTMSSAVYRHLYFKRTRSSVVLKDGRVAQFSE